MLCRQAIATAAEGHGVPPGLMAAVGQVESGRRDTRSGALDPWPWTVDADGQGSFYATKAEAVAAVRTLQAQGVRSIDVGCMQVNLMHHPHAFGSLDQAFDPLTNANYAARFLTDLHGQTASWPRATALYHSTTPELAEAYEQKVMQAWPLQERLAFSDVPVTLARSWGTTVGAGLFPPPPLRKAGVRILPRVTPGGGAAPPGRGLTAYRAMPIMPSGRRTGG